MRSPTPFQIQRCLGGLRYPAGKEEVIRRASERGAGAQVMRLLALLPAARYESPVALARELGRQAENVAFG